MKLKAILFLTPLAVVLTFAQAYFWVPTYESQTTGNPDRVHKFIEASIGDAKILNPILHADVSSGRIVDLVFDGLLALDENLNLRGRLATKWRISETAYLMVVPGVLLADGTPGSAPRLEAELRSLIQKTPALASLVSDIRRERAHSRVEQVPAGGSGENARTLSVNLRIPERIAFTLTRVDQDFFTRLAPVIGDEYGRQFDHRRLVDGAAEAIPDRALREIAARAPVFEHNPVIEFELRRGVRFHDGHEFDAEDVKFTYEAIMSPHSLSPRTSDFEPIKRIELPSPHSLRVVYKRLFSPAINAWTMGILPQHLLGAPALREEIRERGLSAEASRNFGVRNSRFNRHPIGTGPFRFVEWQSDELIHLERNEDYWERPPEYRDFYFRILPDPLAQEVEFRTGGVDTYTPQPHQVARYRGNTAYQAFSAPSLGYTYIGYNNRRPPFDDPRVRRALGMAINVDEIIRFVMYGQGERTTGPYPRTTEWYDHDIAPLPYAPEEALRILTELGWRRDADGWLQRNGKRLEFNLITNNGNPIRKAVLSIAQNAWRQIGVKCNTQIFEWAVFLEDFINPGDFDAVILGWLMGVDPDLYQLWHSSQSGPNQLNFVAYSNPEADRLIERIRREYARASQRALSRQLHARIAADQPYTFLYAPLGTRVLDRKIVMLEPDGSYAPVRASKGGDVFYHLNRWKKLELAPRF